MSQTPLGRLEGKSLLEAWNSQAYRDLRLKFLTGGRPAGCSVCYDVEKSGGVSIRQQINRRHQSEIRFVQETDDEGNVPRLNLKYLDIRWSNLCNFKCRSCSLEWSSSWLTDLIALGGGTDPDLVKQKILAPELKWEEIERDILPNVESICFAGGEPLIQEKTYRIIDALNLLGRHDVRIEIITNLSQLESKGQDLFAKLRPFKQLLFRASADGTEERYEYLRKGGSWEIFSRNLDRLNNFVRERMVPADEVTIYFSVFWINAFHAVDAIPAMESRFQTPVHANLSTSPDESRIDFLPEFAKDALRERYAGINHPELKKIAQYMSQTTLPYAEAIKYFQAYLAFTRDLDRIRGEKFLSAFPEWSRFLRPNPPL